MSRAVQNKSVPLPAAAAVEQSSAASATRPRSTALRDLYLQAALRYIPRLLGAIDRNPFRPTYGCLDRQFWHYRTSDFPSQMYQEGVWPLALVYRHTLPGNRWQGEPRVRELAIAGMRFTALSSHRDGSCDDYYPFERALGAAVFSLQAAAQAYQLLELDDGQLRRWFLRRGAWLARHDESGRLANHQAIAARGLALVAQITGRAEFRQAAEARLRKLLTWQSSEGWFEEYGGADPGYQTVTIDALVACRRLLCLDWLDEPIGRGVAFCRLFLHPDDSYGGEYGSRGTHHFYPHGFELLAARNADAAMLAEGFLRSLKCGKQAYFDDDRMFAHQLGNLLEAWLDWSPQQAVPVDSDQPPATRYLSEAQILVRRSETAQTIVSAARGGVFKHFNGVQQEPVSDAGLVVELTNGRIAVSQSHTLDRVVEVVACGKPAGSSRGSRGETLRQAAELDTSELTLKVRGSLHWARFETATPLKFALLRVGMWTVGRCCRSLVRRLLQRRLITGRKECPVQLTRVFEWFPGGDRSTALLRVTDTIELSDAGMQVRRLAYGVDHQTAYVAACGIYQDGILEPWTDLNEFVAELNARRRVTIVREL